MDFIYYVFIGLLVVYLAILVFIGFYFNKKQKSVTDFWLGGRRIGPIPIGFSSAASWITGGGILSVIAMYITGGLGSVWTFAAPNVIALFAIGLLVGKIKSLPSITQPELLEQRYSGSVRAPVAVIVMIVMMLFAAADVSGLSLIFNIFFGIEPIYAAILIAGAVSIYVLLGGLSAVVWTDVLQFLLLSAVVLFGAVATLGFSTGIFGNVPATVSLEDLFTSSVPGSWWNPISIGIPLVLIFFVAIMPGWVTEHDQWQKVWAARDEKSARNGFFLGSFLIFMIFGVLCCITGLCLRYLYPASSTDFGMAEVALLKFISTSFSPMVVVFAALGLTAAAMSCTDTFATSGGSCISRDIYQRYIKPDATMEHMKLINRVSVLIIILGAVVLSFLPINIIDFIHIATFIATSAYFFPLMGGLYWKRATKQGAVAALVVGGVSQILMCAIDVHLGGSGQSMVTIVTGMTNSTAGLLFECHGVILGMFLSLASYIAVSLMTPAPSKINLAPFFPEEADSLIKTEIESVNMSTPVFKEYRNAVHIDASGERSQIQLEISSSSHIDWSRFTDHLKKSYRNVWVAPTGKDSLYRLTHSDMLSCPRITRGKNEYEIWIAAEPRIEEESTSCKEVYIAYIEVAEVLNALGYRHTPKRIEA